MSDTTPSARRSPMEHERDAGTRAERIPVDPHPHPSSFIQDELDARGWTIADLANRMGFERCVRNKLVLDMYFLIGPSDTRMRIGKITANQLSAAFGISAQFFLDLESAWLRDALAQQEGAKG